MSHTIFVVSCLVVHKYLSDLISVVFKLIIYQSKKNSLFLETASIRHSSVWIGHITIKIAKNNT